MTTTVVSPASHVEELAKAALVAHKVPQDSNTAQNLFLAFDRVFRVLNERINANVEDQVPALPLNISHDLKLWANDFFRITDGTLEGIALRRGGTSIRGGLTRDRHLQHSPLFLVQAFSNMYLLADSYGDIAPQWLGQIRSFVTVGRAAA